MAILKSPVLMMCIAVVLGAAGQFLFKYGLNKAGGQIDLSWRIVQVMFTPFVAAGLLCYVLSTFAYLSALSKVPLSVLYPMISAGYLLIYLVSVLFLGEQFTLMKLFANLLIIAGIVILTGAKK